MNYHITLNWSESPLTNTQREAVRHAHWWVSYGFVRMPVRTKKEKSWLYAFSTRLKFALLVNEMLSCPVTYLIWLAVLRPSLPHLAHGRLRGSSCALMLHYSNWLIGVKNRASLRNASKTPPSPDNCNNRGNTVEVHNYKPLPSEKTAAFAVNNHLLEKGKTVQYTQL